MSETIIGYINSIHRTELISTENEIQQKTDLGFKFENNLNLYNYPENISSREDIVYFIISDSNNSSTATILLNEYDYDPEDESEGNSHSKIPFLLEDRIFEITKIIKTLLNSNSVRELGISLSLCDEIEKVKYTSIESFEGIIVADCVASCPPNTLYLVEK
ncbi:hypothetical protein MHN79_02210 [Vibrio sp. Of14-4]|uniref:hypothetical protein n=1 Tax=Vibrio sp. Of14-4 TaxID=2724878 RepID=UPI001EF22BB9|nr:hypothetical protein [Vibrio sp. Of14-4]MCG7488292.1 hypothetical protein [Vibrio sp. Of14-4]